jgi:hypothetical protein
MAMIPATETFRDLNNRWKENMTITSTSKLRRGPKRRPNDDRTRVYNLARTPGGRLEREKASRRTLSASRLALVVPDRNAVTF